LETARKEKEVVDTRLKETNSKLERTQNDLDGSEEIGRSSARPNSPSFSNQCSRKATVTNEQQQLHAEVAQLKEAVDASRSSVA
jgi:FtsZ-interacting cell division protein ZipA